MSYILLVLLWIAGAYIWQLRDEVKEKEACIQYYIKRDNDVLAALQEAQKGRQTSGLVAAFCKLYYHGEE